MSENDNGFAAIKSLATKGYRRGRPGLAATLQAERLGLPYLGFRIFKWLLGLILLLLLTLILFGTLTYPHQSSYVPTPRTATLIQWQAFETAKAAWATQLKDFGQLFLLTPVFPLLGAVLGYIFGRQVSDAKEGEGAKTPGASPEPARKED